LSARAAHGRAFGLVSADWRSRL